MSEKELTFLKGEKKRAELQLPVLHFVVTDDWMKKLGDDAFCAWLKFFSWCDRSEHRKDTENDVIPASFNRVMKRLGIGKKKFYNSILRPLWNFGLIDIVEYKDSFNKGQKPMNIVVYEYPQNDVTKKYEPLEQIRDYDKDYHSNARTFAKKSSRQNENGCSRGFIKKPGEFHEETRGGFVEKPNNVSNSITNDSNINNKRLDTLDTENALDFSTKRTEYEKSKAKKEQKKEFMKKGFYKNYEMIPERMAEMLEVFSNNTQQAKFYYSIILRAKKKVEKELGRMLLLENEPELESEIINTFSRTIRTVEKERNVNNIEAYIYQAIYNCLSNNVEKYELKGVFTHNPYQ